MDTLTTLGTSGKPLKTHKTTRHYYYKIQLFSEKYLKFKTLISP